MGCLFQFKIVTKNIPTIEGVNGFRPRTFNHNMNCDRIASLFGTVNLFIFGPLQNRFRILCTKNTFTVLIEVHTPRRVEYLMEYLVLNEISLDFVALQTKSKSIR